MPVGKGEEEGRVLQLRFGVKVPTSLAEPKRNSGSAPGGIRNKGEEQVPVQLSQAWNIKWRNGSRAGQDCLSRSQTGLGSASLSRLFPCFPDL